MSFIKYDYIAVNGVTRPGIKRTSTLGLIMHYTANNGGTAQNHHDYFAQAKDYASAQLFVDDTQALCIIPFDEVSYHANDIQRYNADGTPYYPLRGTLGNANYSCVSVEMCLDYNGNITEKTFQNSVKAVKEIITMYPQITRDRIWRHYDVTGKNCPAPWVANSSELDRFKNAVFNKAATTIKKTTTNQIGGIAMFTYQEEGKATIYGVWGNKSFGFKNPQELKDFRNIVKDTTGRTCKHYTWKKGQTPFDVVKKMVG